ncbi:MAG: hypothetical protein KDH89_16490, partial [Anaerolineae bacterium]|nr:hypothetical protein [Anaerolineae bacterium]
TGKCLGLWRRLRIIHASATSVQENDMLLAFHVVARSVSRSGGRTPTESDRIRKKVQISALRTIRVLFYLREK